MELENGDLAASLHELAHNTSRLHDVSCSIRWRGPKLDFPPETATHLFRIAQEALHNAIHHGTASTIDIHITVNPRSIRLTVDDNGNGLPSTPGTPEEGRGMGQKIMRHRADILGGSISLSQRPNANGARLVCSIPSPKPVTPCQHKKRPRSKSRSSKTTH
jgi:signal transduction histidine kinase